MWHPVDLNPRYLEDRTAIEEDHRFFTTHWWCMRRTRPISDAERRHFGLPVDTVVHIERGHEGALYIRFAPLHEGRN